MSRLREKLTYANVMASIAVFLVLGGGAAVAAGLGKGSVGSFQLQRGAVTAAKIKKGAVTPGKIAPGTLPTGVRSAMLVSSGQIDSGQAVGIAQNNISSPKPGLYCFKGLTPPPKTAMAQLAFDADPDINVFVKINPTEGECKGSQAAVATENAKGFVPEPIAVMFN